MTGAALAFRRATREDLPAIVALLADDPLGATREDPSLPLARPYLDAFDLIERDANQELVVACDANEVVGVLQLTVIPSLTRMGASRAQVDGVRIAQAWRGRGAGRAMLEWALARARERGCSLVQLTTDKSRPDAKRFYESLGFTASHEGMKLALPDRPVSR